MKLKEKFTLGIWNIGIIESTIEEVFKEPDNIKIKWVKHNYKDRFFADPFLQDEDVKYYYILAEEYLFYEGKGRIVRLTVNKETLVLVHIEVILNDKHHLSYPYILAEYIIPEGYRSGALFAYKLSNDGTYYEKLKIIDKGLIDQTFLQFYDKDWIFATMAEPTKEDALSKLSIYYKNEHCEYVPHKLNPVKDDIKTSRPGGMFFVFNGELYRPVQDCEKRYGHMIRIMKIKKLNEEEFEEEEVMAITSEKSPPYNLGIHTFNVYKNMIVVDGYREVHSFLLKPIYKIFRKLIIRMKKDYLEKGKEIKIINFRK